MEIELNDKFLPLQDNEKQIFLQKIKDIMSQIKHYSDVEKKLKKAAARIPNQIEIIEKYKNDEIDKETFYIEIKYRASLFNYMERYEFLQMSKDELLKTASKSLELDIKDFKKAEFFLNREKNNLGSYIELTKISTKNKQEMTQIIIDKYGNDILKQIRINNLEKQPSIN